jgi:hypothetical protein
MRCVTRQWRVARMQIHHDSGASAVVATTIMAREVLLFAYERLDKIDVSKYAVAL